MAEDFLPVGIRAVAENVDSFVSGLGRMQKAVTSFGTSATEASNKSRQVGQGASTSVQGLTQLTSALNLSIAANNRLASQIATLTGALSAGSAASTRAAGSQRQLAAASTQAQASSGQLGQAVRNLGTAFTATDQGVARMDMRIDALRAAEAQLVAENGTLQSSFGKVSGRMQFLQQQLRITNDRADKYENELRQVEEQQKVAAAATKGFADSLKYVRSGGAGAIQQIQLLESWLERARQEERALGDQASVLRSQLQTAANASMQNEAAVRNMSTAYKNSKQALQLNEAELQELRNEIKSTEGQIRSMNQVLLLNESVMKASRGAWIALTTTVKVFKGVVQGIIGTLTALNNGFKKVISGLQSFNNKIKSAGSHAFRMGNSIRFLGTSMTFLISLPVIGFLTGLTKSAIDFEDAFAGVIRTVDQADFRLLPEGETDIRNLTELGERLQKGIRQLALEIPIPAAELAKLGEVAGTLGVRGVGNLETFIGVTAKLGATTNVTAEESARALGKILGVTGLLSDAELAMNGFTEAEIENLSQSERFQATLNALGGVVVDLGNKMIAQEDETLKFALEIAGAGDVIGFTAKELLTVGAAFSSVGVAASRGRTAFQKTVFGMLEAVEKGGEELEIFAKVAGQTSDEFRETWGASSAEAFRRFVEGLGTQGSKAIAILDSLGLADNRVAQALLTLSSSEGKLTQATNIANEELANQIDNMSALELEAARRFSTTASNLQLLKNQFAELGITVGSIVLPELNKVIKVVRSLIDKISQLSPQVLRMILAFLGIVAVIGPLVTFSGLFLASLGFIVQTIGFVIGVVLSLASTLSILILPIGAVIAALVGLGIALLASINKMEFLAEKGFSGFARTMFDFGKNIILSFARGMARAAAAVITVLNSIGRAIAYWLRPGSPPKLLPDLDKWGTEAMNSYLAGWTSADFGIFNKIANQMERVIRAFSDPIDQAGKENMIERIFGSRRQIKSIVDQFKKSGKVAAGAIDGVVKSVGNANTAVRNYVKALLDLELAQARVERIQARITAVTDRYAEKLKPLNDRLGQISDRFQEIQDAMRIRELEEILADPRATELVREMAQLELEEIGIQADVRGIEDQRDTELAILETRLQAAEAEAKAAQERFDASEAALELIVKERELLNELKETAKKLKKDLDDSLKASDLDLSDISGVGEVDTSGLDNLGDELLDSVDDIIDEINQEFAGLVADLQAIFDPLKTLWDELGETWAPIFDTIFGPIEEFLGVKFQNPFKDYLMPSETMRILENPTGAKHLREMVDLGEVELFSDQHIRSVTELGDALTENIIKKSFPILGFLADIGLIEPFGPLAEQARFLDQSLKKTGGEFESFTEIGGKLKPVIDTLATFFGSLVSAFTEGLRQIDFSGFAEDWKAFTENLESSGAADGLRLLAGILGGVVATSFGVVLGLINGLLTAIRFMLPFIAGILGGVALLAKGISEFFGGLIDALTGVPGGLDRMGDAIFQILGGIGQIAWGLVGGILAGIIGLVAGFGESFFGFLARFTAQLGTEWSATWADVFAQAQQFWADILAAVSGFIDSVIEFFSNLYNELIGNSIVVDLLNGIFDQFDRLAEVAQIVLDWVNGVIEDFLGLKDQAIEGITDFIEEVKTKFEEMKTDAEQWIKDVVNAIVDGFKTGIRNKIESAKEAIGEFAEGVKEKVKGILNIRSPSKEFQEMGEQTIEGWVKGLEATKTKVIKLLEDIVNLMVSTFTQATVALTEIHTQMWETNLQILAENLVKFAERLLDTLNIIVLSGDGSIWGRAMVAFIKLFQDMMNDFEDLVTEWLEIIQDSLNQILEAITEMLPDFVAIGEAIGNSMLDGLNKSAGKLISRAKAIANEIKDIINRAYELHSPSRVFMRIGENIIEGWAIGMENEARGLVRTVKDIASAMQAQATPASLPSMPTQAVLPASASTLAGQQTTNYNTIDMGGQVIQNGIDALTLQVLIERALENVLK